MSRDKSGYSIFDGTISDMTWIEVEKAAENNSIMLIPVGVIEQHGPHLPLGTDAYGAYTLCRLTKKELETLNIPTVIAPPYYYGIANGARKFPGTINVSKESMTAMLTDILVSLMDSGFKKQVLINHHGEPAHIQTMLKAIANAREKGVDAVLVVAGFSVQREWNIPESHLLRQIMTDESKKVIKQNVKSRLDIHAGETETSLIMRWFPEILKDEENIGKYEPVIPSIEEIIKNTPDDWREYYPLGYLGEPHLGDPKKGELHIQFSRDIANAITKYIS
jgi:creatinine amidohydrolase